jgi:copper chaperone CopZ
MMEKTLKIVGMHCKSCAILLGDVASEIEGVKSASVDLAKGTMKVVIDSDAVRAKLVKAIEAQGYRVAP